MAEETREIRTGDVLPLREVDALAPVHCGVVMQRIASPSGATILNCNRCGQQQRGDA